MKVVELNTPDVYSKIKTQLRPFDLLAFKGPDTVSDLIRCIEAARVTRSGVHVHPADFSHVGMLVNSEILDHPMVETGKWYIWESTMSGSLTDGIKNVAGETFLGVQLRCLDEVVQGYLKSPKAEIAWCKLKQNPLEQFTQQSVKQRFTAVFRELDHNPYDCNIGSLFCAVYRCCRPWRTGCEALCMSGNWLFCSELVALIYRLFEVLPEAVNEKDVLPVDLIYPNQDNDSSIPLEGIVEAPVRIHIG